MPKGSPDMILKEFYVNFDEKKVIYLPGPVDPPNKYKKSKN